MIKYSMISNFIKINLLFVLIISLSITFIFELYCTRQKSIELHDVGFKYCVGIIKILEKEIIRDEYKNDKNSQLNELRFINYLNAESRYNKITDISPRLYVYLIKTRNVFDYSHHLGDVLKNKTTLEEMQNKYRNWIIW